MSLIDTYEDTLVDILDATHSLFSMETPSQFYASRMVMPQGSAIPGPFSYEQTPHWQEPADCFSEYHPAEFITVMGGAQGGKSVAFIMAALAYIIGISPGNTLFLTGHNDLSEEAMDKIDFMIQQCRLQHRIGPPVIKPKGGRTGDTVKEKSIINGNVTLGSVTNHKLLRQRDKRYIFVDDFSAAPMFSKASGSTRQKVIQRTAAFKHNRKIAFISSPERFGTCNIHASFLLSDQRYRHVPCPCCGTMIVLEWNVKVDERETAGITWKLDSACNVIRSSVGYICQSCSRFFTSKHKYEMNLAGQWVPSVANPIEPNHWGYQYSNLYAPAGFADWTDYVQVYVKANPQDGNVDDTGMQQFNNEVLGIPHKSQGESPKASALYKNIRSYEVGTVPEAVSIKDGNGPIVLLTCACDMNGTMEGVNKAVVDDARLDWEVRAWSASGSCYSVIHGSIGTFIPMEGDVKADRLRWTYDWSKPNNVWDKLEEILSTVFLTDTGRQMKVGITALDTGYLSREYGWPYIDKTNHFVVGVKGDKEAESFLKNIADVPTFKQGQQRSDLYIVNLNKTKDDLAAFIRLKWDPKSGHSQPSGFMNFPQPSGGLYDPERFFKHYEAEQRRVDETGLSSRWEKKNSVVQNHFWDVAVYNYAVRDIYVHLALKEAGIKGGWREFADIASGIIKQKLNIT